MAVTPSTPLAVVRSLVSGGPAGGHARACESPSLGAAVREAEVLGSFAGNSLCVGRLVCVSNLRYHRHLRSRSRKFRGICWQFRGCGSWFLDLGFSLDHKKTNNALFAVVRIQGIETYTGHV